VNVQYILVYVKFRMIQNHLVKTNHSIPVLLSFSAKERYTVVFVSDGIEGLGTGTEHSKYR
jgi:hypothetical protein